MRKSFAAVSVLFISIVVISYITGSCRKSERTLMPDTMAQVIPESFPLPVYRFQDNRLTKQGFELGRELFYDGRLSVDGGFPCSSCHQQLAGFGTYEHDRSHGYNHSHTLRNAPVLFNLAWQKEFHWDGEFTSLYDEAEQPINSHNEMAESFATIIPKLQADATYPRKFRIAFGTEEITEDRILKALAQFTGNLTSADSKYDRVKKGSASFTESEARGYELFKIKCATCHTEPLFTDHNFYNIGLPVDIDLNDYGKMRITHKSEDSLKFKVPTLRNVNISANFMHDGRFNTLAQVLDHYISGVQASPTLDSSLTNGIQLSAIEKTDVISFMKALTDSSFISNPKYSKPQ